MNCIYCNNPILSLDDDTHHAARCVYASVNKEWYCANCNRIKDFHCGHQYWCYDNYHLEKPTKWEPK